MTGERLHKVLAAAGVASRRRAERMILEGRVSVNGRVVRSLGNKVEPTRDRIVVDGKVIRLPETHRYLLVNKPAGVLTTVSDPFNRPTVIDLVRHSVTDAEGNRQRLYPIGRLDLDSEGLLLLTNDGQLAHRVSHPSTGLEKEYRVRVRGTVTEEKLERLRTGIMLDGRPTAPAVVELERQEGPSGAVLRFVLHEGRKRQVRRMCEAVELRVVRLVRTRIGPIELGSLRPGQCRDLTEREVALLRQAVGLGDAAA
ncbi:MAG: pseudouridine synthase [Chloroflexota bacterium]|nr:rRNA pseudouridine synthase [Dehalococcoidia bacterium]MDW8253860.1 pseudouridine synthase [Chloroflexota bacterium]